MSEIPYVRGLAGVPAGTTKVSEIDPVRQKLAYRGYDIEDLVNHKTFEEVAYLLLVGELATPAQLDAFKAELASESAIPEGLFGAFRQIPSSSHPMDTVRTAVSFLGQFDPEAPDNSPEADLRKAKRLTAKLATCVAAAYRIKIGQPVVEPRSDFSHAKNFLYMMSGTEPDDLAARSFDTTLILYAEHSFNASTFTARVIASTKADLHSAVTGAVGALKGPLHGGANEKAMEMFLDIGEPEKAEPFVMDLLNRKQLIMGIGHRVYKGGDSRVPTMKRLGKALAERGDPKWMKIADIVESTALREKNLHPNVDFPCAYVYYYLGLPLELYTPIFAASRITGWAAHIMEQHAEKDIIRPACIYEGERGRTLA